MYNSDPSVASAATGVAGAVTGVAVLPNTGGNLLATVFSVALIAGGAIIVTSFIVTRISSRFIK